LHPHKGTHTVRAITTRIRSDAMHTMICSLYNARVQENKKNNNHDNRQIGLNKTVRDIVCGSPSPHQTHY